MPPKLTSCATQPCAVGKVCVIVEKKCYPNKHPKGKQQLAVNDELIKQGKPVPIVAGKKGVSLYPEFFAKNRVTMVLQNISKTSSWLECP